MQNHLGLLAYCTHNSFEIGLPWAIGWAVGFLKSAVITGDDGSRTLCSKAPTPARQHCEHVKHARLGLKLGCCPSRLPATPQIDGKTFFASCGPACICWGRFRTAALSGVRASPHLVEATCPGTCNHYFPRRPQPRETLCTVAGYRDFSLCGTLLLLLWFVCCIAKRKCVACWLYHYITLIKKKACSLSFADDCFPARQPHTVSSSAHS